MDASADRRVAQHGADDLQSLQRPIILDEPLRVQQYHRLGSLLEDFKVCVLQEVAPLRWSKRSSDHTQGCCEICADGLVLVDRQLVGGAVVWQAGPKCLRQLATARTKDALPDPCQQP